RKREKRAGLCSNSKATPSTSSTTRASNVATHCDSSHCYHMVLFGRHLPHGGGVAQRGRPLLQGHFTRAAAWFCVGVGMLLWWNGTETIPHPWDFEAWLKASAWVVGLGALATFVRWRKKQQAMQAIARQGSAMPTMPAWTPPADALGNTAPVIEVE